MSDTTALAIRQPTQLAQLDRARQMLAESRTLSDVKKIRDIAEAAKVYAKAAHLGRESQNYAAEIALLAARPVASNASGGRCAGAETSFKF